MRQYLEMGVGGIISDYPEELRTVLDTYLAAHPYQDTIWQEEGFPPGAENTVRMISRLSSTLSWGFHPATGPTLGSLQ